MEFRELYLGTSYKKQLPIYLLYVDCKKTMVNPYLTLGDYIPAAPLNLLSSSAKHCN